MYLCILTSCPSNPLGPQRRNLPCCLVDILSLLVPIKWPDEEPHAAGRLAQMLGECHLHAQNLLLITSQHMEHTCRARHGDGGEALFSLSPQ